MPLKPQPFTASEKEILLNAYLYVVTFAGSKLGLHYVDNLPYCNYFILLLICHGDSQVHLDKAIQ